MTFKQFDQLAEKLMIVNQISLNGFFSTTNIFSSDELFYPLDNVSDYLPDDFTLHLMGLRER
jgi:hypothetical protein